MCNYRLNIVEAKQARAMHEAGESLTAIAQHFGCTRFAVKSGIVAVGGTVRPKDEATRLRHGVTLEHEGRRMTISEWARHLGLARTTLASRWQAGKPVTEILR